MLTFNTKNMAPQYFALPAPTMNYIFKNLQPQHLLKLYQTSKFFYNKFRQNIIINLVIVADGEIEVFDPTKSIICVSNPFLSNLKDFWITDSFTCRTTLNIGILPKFSHCTIKKLKLNEHISWNDFVMLTEAGTVEKLKIVGIYGKTPLSVAPVEEIIAQVPNATTIGIFNCFFDTTTATALISVNHKVKILNLILANISSLENFEVKPFCKFILKNAHHGCNVHFDFQFVDGDDDAILGVNKELKKFGENLTELITLLLLNTKLKRKLLKKSPVTKYCLILFSVLLVGHVLFTHVY
uniref:F-box domain-containing protein n=1 Tax=Panagrolaimus superbus TaxID=310955 RepID=A0A914Y0P2_9BILA